MCQLFQFQDVVLKDYEYHQCVLLEASHTRTGFSTDGASGCGVAHRGSRAGCSSGDLLLMPCSFIAVQPFLNPAEPLLPNKILLMKQSLDTFNFAATQFLNSSNLSIPV